MLLDSPSRPMSLETVAGRFNQWPILEAIEKEFEPFSTRGDGVGYMHRKARDLTAILSFATEGDTQVWKHVSFARQKRMPTYGEIEEYKALFCGEDSYAIVVFPPKDKWVSIHPYCVHLWEPMEFYPLPEFSGMLLNGQRTI